MDSIISVEWINELNKRYGTEIPATKIYDYPTVFDFTGYIEREIAVKDVSPLQEDISSIQTDNEVQSRHTDSNDIASTVITTLADALSMSIDDLDPGETFVNLGVDSIVGVEWINEINRLFGINLTATKIYNYPTINEFIEFICKEMTHHDKSPGDTLSLDQLLLKIKQGHLDPEKAEMLLKKI
jgi:acyl carrier protein